MIGSAGGEALDAAPEEESRASGPAGPSAWLVVVVAFAGFTLVLGWAFDRAIDLPGSLDCATSPGIYSPPCPQQFSLVWVLAADAAAALVLAVVAWRWRRVLLGVFPDCPPGAGRWLLGTKRPVNVLGVLAFAAAVALQLPYGPNFDLARSYGVEFHFGALEEAIVRAPIWLASVPVLLSVVTILDVYEVARRGGNRFVPPDEARVSEFVTLRQTLDSSLWLLGFQLGLWVVSQAAVAEYVIAVASADSPGASAEPTAGTTIVVMGAVVTAILALLYVPTALAVDAVAMKMLDAADRLGGVEGVVADDLRPRVGVDQSVQERLYKGLSIAAPLAGALVTTLVL